MQHHKEKFNDPTYQNTFCNIQPCIRTNDLDEFGDDSHLILFHMMGMFSFRELPLSDAISFWMSYVRRVGIEPTHVTIHPDKTDWERFYEPYGVEVRLDEDCTWSDGNIGGYCTEFFVGDLEIGNIVNTNGDCIDVGFGLERLAILLGEDIDHDENLVSTISLLIDSGIRPSSSKHGYVLKRLIRMLLDTDTESLQDHPIIVEEKRKQEKSKERYFRLKEKHRDKDESWWWETHGIDVKLIE